MVFTILLTICKVSESGITLTVTKIVSPTFAGASGRLMSLIRGGVLSIKKVLIVNGRFKRGVLIPELPFSSNLPLPSPLPVVMVSVAALPEQLTLVTAAPTRLLLVILKSAGVSPLILPANRIRQLSTAALVGAEGNIVLLLTTFLVVKNSVSLLPVPPVFVAKAIQAYFVAGVSVSNTRLKYSGVFENVLVVFIDPYLINVKPIVFTATPPVSSNLATRTAFCKPVDSCKDILSVGGEAGVLMLSVPENTSPAALDARHRVKYFFLESSPFIVPETLLVPLPAAIVSGKGRTITGFEKRAVVSICQLIVVFR